MSKGKLTVYTCVFGDTDPLHDSKIKSDAEFICFTDNPNLKSNFWRMVHVGPVPTPTRQSRVMKALSHQYTNTEWSLWTDCNFTFKVDPLSLLHYGDFVNFRHPYRDNLHDEAMEIIRLKKAKKETVLRQLKAYERDGFQIHATPPGGLACNGVILRHHTADIRRLNEAWKAELDRYSLRDQMCVDYVLWKHQRIPAKWPGVYTKNPYFGFTVYRRPVNDY